jgi:2-(1,2-epoxy-1,2-dihydrophenyl)acetyl-CoA isomerase
VAALSGEVSTPFFGATLAMDFRFATEDLVFVLPHTKFGLHPTGGLPYFLPRYIGQGKAMEYLMTGKQIPAQQARKLNLINDILSGRDFDDQVIKRTQLINQNDLGTISISKRLVYFNRDEIINYFDQEMELLS